MCDSGSIQYGFLAEFFFIDVHLMLDACPVDVRYLSDLLSIEAYEFRIQPRRFLIYVI